MAENNNGDGGNAGGGQNNDGGAQNQGGDGKNTTDGGAGSSAGQQNQGTGGNSGEKTFTQADVDRILAERLGRTKQQHDADIAKARENASKPLQEQLDAISKQLSERQAADVERNGKLAMASVYQQLAENGVTKADVKDVLDTFDPNRLLKDGEPDDAAIEKFAKGLAKVAGRVVPDPDQGQGGSGNAPQTMPDFMRRLARK